MLPLAARARSLVLALVLCALTACARPKPPTVTPTVARVVAVSNRGVDLEVTLAVHNPNGFALSARAVAGTLFLDGQTKLGTGQATPQESIPARGSAEVRSQVQVAWESLPSLQKFLGREQVPYDFKGSVTLGGEALDITLPFELKGTLTRDQLLQAGLRGLFPPAQ
jgi:LEA14-like dessication related protein